MSPVNRSFHREQLTLQLLLSEGIGPAGTATILKTFPEAETAGQIPAHHPGLKRWSEPIAALRQGKNGASDIERQRDLWEKRGITPIFPGGEGFPPRLIASPYCPAVLFVCGEWKEGSLQALKAITVVGTRRATPYGERVCRKLIGELAPFAPTIVSGLARGIDRIAHREALRLQLPTVAVLGQGLLTALDYDGKLLAQQIAEQGAVLSPFPPEQEPQEWTFPFRNRILSGLSQGTLIVESGLKGGALITGRLSIEEGREVMAVPGPIDSERSEGCNRLIAEGAHPALDGASIATLLRWKEEKLRLSLSPPPELEEKEREVWLACSPEGQSVDSLFRALSLEPHHGLAILTELEMKGAVRLLPGNRIERC